VRQPAAHKMPWQTLLYVLHLIGAAEELPSHSWQLFVCGVGIFALATSWCCCLVAVVLAVGCDFRFTYAFLEDFLNGDLHDAAIGGVNLWAPLTSFRIIRTLTSTFLYLDDEYAFAEAGESSDDEYAFPEAHRSRELGQQRRACFAAYDANWVEETGAKPEDWQEYIVLAFLVPALLQILGPISLRMYAGDGLYGCFFWTKLLITVLGES